METERFERAVRELGRMVFGIALHALRDRSMAEEITQDVFLALLEHRERIQSDEHLVYWLRQVTSRRCIDQMRKQRWRRWLLLGEAGEAAGGVASSTAPGDPLLSARLEKLIRALPAPVRVALVLRYQVDLDPAEIGRVLGLPEKTVRKKLRHALNILKSRLDRPRTVMPAELEQP